MSGLHERYMAEMHAEFGYFANWLPASPLKLGDVGVMDGNQFKRITDLSALGIGFTPGEPGPSSTMEYTSSGAVRVDHGLRAETELVQARGDVTVEFSREAATFFQAEDCVETAIADLARLETDLLALHGAGAWRPEHVVISAVVTTGPAVILVSRDQNASVKLSVRVDGLGGPVALARARADATITAARGLATSLVSTHITPFYRAVDLRRRITGKRRLRFRSRTDGATVRLDEVAWREPE